MPAARARLVAAVVALAVLFGVGVFWLARLATGGSPSSFVGPQTESAAPSVPAVLASPSKVPTSGPSAPTITRSPPSRSPSRPRDTRPPVPSRAITVGGVTLDNDNPRTMCLAFKNVDFGVPVRIAVVRLSGTGVEASSGQCADDDNIRGFPATRVCQAGTVLRPGGDGCYYGIGATSTTPGQYVGTVRLRLTARCTRPTVAPCSARQLRSSPPSRDRPIDVVWTDPGRQACVKVREPEPTPPPEPPICEDWPPGSTDQSPTAAGSDRE